MVFGKEGLLSKCRGHKEYLLGEMEAEKGGSICRKPY